ncbi:PilZ domain-containing protein [Sphingobium algorifonticola]|uniref:PilZ domain-containing protein n=1 Tax=Sphingobium algorifonticola TaxID=2008318 RepID=A0A437J9A6_9SPHN|nr:PilZ domain-containing protein [Sphingobium algorifonticola]RVT41902.1 PilZ domain-containing protein [Sphingobium algorifonticola]
MGIHKTFTTETSRSDQRHNVLIGVKLRRPGETWFTSRVSDLSPTGFRIQTFVKLAPGMDLWIMLPGFEGRRAQVMWARDHEAGCNFERPLHPAIFDHIIRLAKVRNSTASKPL